MGKKRRSILSYIIILTIIINMLPISFVSADSFGGVSDEVLYCSPEDTTEDDIESDEPYVFTDEDTDLIEEDVFDKIDTLENGIKRRGSGDLSEADYAGLIPRVMEIVENSETYVDDTLQQNGDFLVWETTVGIPCCYSPKMEAQKSSASYTASVGKTEDFAAPRRGGHPSSLKIGLIQPYWDSPGVYLEDTFEDYSPYYLELMNKLCAATGAESIRYTLEDATVDAVAYTVEECGLVIFDSHGTTDYENPDDYYDCSTKANCSYLILTSAEGITSDDAVPKQGQFGTYYDCLYGLDYICVSGDCIANHMTKNADNSFVYLAECNGMSTDKMESGLRSKGVEAIWGYSQSVTFDGEILYAESILESLAEGAFLTDAVSDAKAALGIWDPGYAGYSEAAMRREFAAFPIVVSSEDPYPGHGNVDDYQEVNSTWSLFPKYDVGACVNGAGGSVSVRGYTVTAVPDEGYYLAGYEVISGDATVWQNGEELPVIPASDCTVEVSFAETREVDITFSSDGEELFGLEVETGDTLILPEIAPEVFGFEFAGWSEREFTRISDDGGIYAPGDAVYVTGDTNWNAVYVRYGTEYVYNLQSDVPYIMPGEYIITHGKPGDDMKVMAGIDTDSYYWKEDGAKDFSDTGMSLDGTVITGAEDIYLFEFESYDEGFGIMNKAKENYLSAYFGTGAEFDPYYCLFAGSVLSNGYAVIETVGRNFLFSYVNTYFGDDHVADRIYLWKREPVTTAVYTTVTHEEDFAVVNGASITLDGLIGLNFYAEKTGDFDELVLSGPNGDVVYSGSKQSGRYTYPLYAAQIGEKVSLKFYKEGSEVRACNAQGYLLPDNYSCSVSDYIAFVNKKDVGDSPEKLRSLAQALYDYGAYAYFYFGYKNVTEGSEVPVRNALQNVAASQLSEYALVDNSGADITVSDNSLILKEGTYLKVFFTATTLPARITAKSDADTSATVLKASEADGMYYVTIENIAASELDDTITIDFGSGRSIKISALTYAYSLLSEYGSDASQEKLLNVIKALYVYNLAAEAYMTMQ